MVWLADSATFLFGVALSARCRGSTGGVVLARLRRVLFAPMFVVNRGHNSLEHVRDCGSYGAPASYPLFAILGGGVSRLCGVPAVAAGIPPPMQAAFRAPRTRPDTAAAPQIDLTKALLGKVLGGEPKVRCTHYKFAHQALRQAAMENPSKCVGLLQSPVAQRFLDDLWDAVRTGCTQSASPGSAAEPGPQGLGADMTQVGPYSAVIVTLPQAPGPDRGVFRRRWSCGPTSVPRTG